MKRVKAIFQMRCGHCLRGNVFRSFWRTNQICPVCGIQFEREPGYFTMAIFFGYILDFILIIPAGIAWYINEWPTLPFFTVLTLILLLLAPFVFRLARVLWLHIDELIDPRER